MPENLEVDEKVTTFAHVNETSRDGAEVARWAHNPKVIRSSRISATKDKKNRRNAVLLFYDNSSLLTLFGSVVILGGLSLVNSLHAYTFASLKRKKLISTTPLNDALNALILALNASAAAFVLLFTKKFRILS